MLRGEFIKLRPAKDNDREIINGWQNDKEVNLLLTYQYPCSRKLQNEYIEKLFMNKNELIYIIEAEDEIPIGYCNYKNIDWKNSICEIVVVLHAKNCRGKGIGYDAIKCATYFALYDLNMYTVYGLIIEKNIAAVKSFEKVGYVKEGILKNRIIRDGECLNLISMSISK